MWLSNPVFWEKLWDYVGCSSLHRMDLHNKSRPIVGNWTPILCPCSQVPNSLSYPAYMNARNVFVLAIHNPPMSPLECNSHSSLRTRQAEWGVAVCENLWQLLQHKMFLYILLSEMSPPPHVAFCLTIPKWLYEIIKLLFTDLNSEQIQRSATWRPLGVNIGSWKYQSDALKSGCPKNSLARHFSVGVPSSSFPLKCLQQGNSRKIRWWPGKSCSWNTSDV